jgi:two-component system response regulator LytT
MKAIIIDDEPLARTYLRGILSEHDIDIVAEGATGVDALRLCEEHRPDIAFLDIEMPNLSGMQVVKALNQLSPNPLVVFVTGYSEHATTAFEFAAFDYLLKPVQPERLAITLVRANNALARLNGAHPSSGSAVPARLPVRSDYAIKLIRIDEIKYALAKEKKVFLVTENTNQKTYYTLNQLEKLLPTDQFLRIHSSVIVKLAAIDEMNFLGNHSYSVKLRSGEVLPVGRTHFANLQKRLGVSS